MKIEIEYDYDDGKYYVSFGKIRKVFDSSVQLYNFLDGLFEVVQQ